MKELIERLEHTDELSGDSVWEVREALKKQLTKIAEHLDTIERLTSEHNELQDTFAVSLLRVKQLEAERDSYQRVCDLPRAEEHSGGLVRRCFRRAGADRKFGMASWGCSVACGGEVRRQTGES